MKILIISQYYSPDITAAAFRMSETVSGLEKKGIEVHVITSTPHKSNLTSQNIDNKNITRIKIPFFKKQIRLTYLFQYLLFSFGAIKSAFKLKKFFKYDLILASSPPITIALPAFLIKILTGKPLIFDIRDVWPDSAAAINKIKKHGLVYKFFKLVEAFIYTKADYITCVAAPMKEYIFELSKKNNIQVIYNGASDYLLSYNKKEQKIAIQPKEFVFTYAGNIGYAQDLKSVIYAFSEFLKDQDDSSCRLQLIGNGPEKNEIVALVKKLRIVQQVSFLNEVPKSEIAEILVNSEVLLIPLISSPVFKLTIPSKVFDYMTFGIPIIATIQGEGRDILSKSDANIITPLNDIDLTSSFLKMFNDYPSYKKLSFENKKTVQNYTRMKSTNDFYETFMKVLNKE
ncbi:glycosyltransferase family 4 protein [bacterium]|nr:glycosyltransferase family 4 protein [bacterium]